MQRALAARGGLGHGQPTPPDPPDDRRRFDGRPGGALAHDRRRRAISRSSASPAPPRTRSTRSSQVDGRHHPARRRNARRERPRRRCPTSSQAGKGARVLIVSSMAEDGAEDDRARAGAGRRRHPAQARHRQFRRPLLRGARRPAAPHRPRRPRARPPRRSAAPPADPAARHARRAARLRRARRLDRRPPRLGRVPRARCPSGSARRSWSPSICRPSFMPVFRPPARKRVGPRARVVAEDGEPLLPDRIHRRAGRCPSAASTQVGGRLVVRLDRKRAASAAACPRSIRCWPRSPRSTAPAASA